MLPLWIILCFVSLLRLVSSRITESSALRMGQILELECLDRDEDGEVFTLLNWSNNDKAIEDENKERKYIPFLTCNETRYPPAFKFRHSTSKQRIPCTVTVDDPTFHTFQAYLHQDYPLVCRVPSRNSDPPIWAHIPISLVGKVELSHVDIEPQLNFIFHYDRFRGWVTGGVGYSVGQTVTSQTVEQDLGWQRVKIGDQLTFEISLRWTPFLLSQANRRWISTEEIPNEHSHSGTNAVLIMIYPFLAGIGFMALFRMLYSVVWERHRIANVRQPTRFETAGISMATNNKLGGQKVKAKREREMV